MEAQNSSQQLPPTADQSNTPPPSPPPQSVAPQVQSVVIEPEKPKSKLKIFIIILSVLILIGASFFGYFIFKRVKSVSESTQLQITPTNSPIPLSEGNTPIDSATRFLKGLQTNDIDEMKKWSLLIEKPGDEAVVSIIGKPFEGKSEFNFDTQGRQWDSDGETATLEGTVTTQDNTVKRFTISLQQQNEIWKVVQLGYKIP